jgi:outer membrane PBP1 activator LpoA protein
MKTKIKYLLVLVLASFVFAGCTTTIGSNEAKQWEYKTVRINLPDTDLQAQLNDAGKDGWKLLTIQTEQPNPGYSEYIFERPIH